MLKIGAKSNDVIAIQHALNLNGANLTTDGVFGAKTEQALKAFQKSQLTKDSGVLDLETEAILLPIILPCATKMFLKRGQYRHTTSVKSGVCLHHTAGGSLAENVVNVWNGDDRGRVATHFIVGGKGEIVQAMPLQCWGHHILMERVGLKNDIQINSGYVGIEICNWGYLDKVGNSFYNYKGGVMRPVEVETLQAPFMGKLHWHKYTDAQVQSVRLILAQLKELYGFIYESLPLDATWLELDKRAQEGKRVLTTHTNFEGKYKADCSPQKAFFKMIEPF